MIIPCISRAVYTAASGSSSGQSWTLERAASRISCPSMPIRVSPIPYTGHWQMNSSGPAGGRPHPPLKELRVRAAAATARLQDRPCGFEVTAWSSADGRTTIGELHADREVLRLPAPAPQHLRRRVFIEAGSARPDAAGQEEFESPGVGRYPDDRYRGLLGPVKVKGIDRHDARKFRLRRVPRVMHPARRRFGGR
jgi:hypothetical protein